MIRSLRSKGRVDGRSDSVHERFGLFFVTMSCWKIHRQCFWVSDAQKWATLTKEQGRVSIVDSRCKSDQVQVWELCANCGSFKKSLVNPMNVRRRRATDCIFQVPAHQESGREKFFNPVDQARRTQARHGATDCISQVSRQRETGRIKFQSGFNLSQKASLVNPPTQCRGGTTLWLTQQGKHLMIGGWAPKKSQPIFHLSQKGPRALTQASQLAGTMSLNIFPKIRIVKLSSSQRLLKLRAGTARMHEVTVFTHRKKC